jgi:hypothetical protein
MLLNDHEYLKTLAVSDNVKTLRQSEHVRLETKMCIDYLTRNSDDLEIVIELPYTLYVAELEATIGKLKERIKNYELTYVPE